MQTRNPLDSLVPKKAAFFLAAITSLALFLPSGKAAVLVSDDFSTVTNVNPLVNGTTIDGRVTPVGGATWTSVYGSSSIYNGGVTADSSGGYGIFTVPFSVGSSTSFEIDARVYPQGNNLNLAFTADAAAAQIQPSTTLMLAINGGGGWAMFNGRNQLPGSGTTTLSIGATYHDVVLAYNVLTTTVTVTYDGTQIYQGVTSLTDGGAGGLASITRAGFSYNQIGVSTTTPEFDSFALIAVPEPQTWALAGLGASVILFRVRRKARVA